MSKKIVSRRGGSCHLFRPGGYGGRNLPAAIRLRAGFRGRRHQPAGRTQPYRGRGFPRSGADYLPGGTHAAGCVHPTSDPRQSGTPRHPASGTDSRDSASGRLWPGRGRPARLGSARGALPFRLCDQTPDAGRADKAAICRRAQRGWGQTVHGPCAAAGPDRAGEIAAGVRGVALRVNLS